MVDAFSMEIHGRSKSTSTHNRNLSALFALFRLSSTSLFFVRWA